MIRFSELKPIIAKSCSSETSQDLQDMLHFSIDFEKLESGLRENYTCMHVLSFVKRLDSAIPTIYDMQHLMEYPIKQEATSKLFMKNRQEFIQFMILYDPENNLLSDTKGFSGNEMTAANVFQLLNNDIIHEGFQWGFDLIGHIIDHYPITRVIVTKHFNSDKERFDYTIFFRSNQEMRKLIKESKTLL